MRPLPVVFRARALDDLTEIADYIPVDDPATASRVIQCIHHSIFKTLANFPNGGRREPETGVREFAVPGLPYLILSIPLPDALDVIGVFHTSRAPSQKPGP